MNKSLITASVIDQTIQLVNCPLIASGGVDEVKITFDFCSLWDGCGKTAVFYRNPEEVYHVPIVDGVATVPYEVLTEAGFFYFGVMGAATNVRTTEVLRVKVVQGAITEATNVPDVPTPDIYQQLLASYGETQAALALERARIDELAAMRGSNGEKKYAAAIDGKHAVNINCNGTGALVSVKITAIPAGYDYAFEDIPAEFAPVSPGLVLGSDGVRVVFGVNNGKVVLRILSTEAATSTAVYVGSYPLANPYIDELGDIRVGADGATYPTAGDAVRGQFQKLSDTASIQQLLIGAEVQTRAEADAKQEAALAEMNKPYELIEEFTLDADVIEVFRNEDSNGNAYNFSAMRIAAEIAPSSGEAQFICTVFTTSPTSGAFYIPVNGGINTAKRVNTFVIRNDKGFTDCFAAHDQNYNQQVRASVLVNQWKNVTKIKLFSGKEGINLPAGTRIRIYGIRG